MQAQVLIVDDNAENVNLAASVLFSEDIDIAAALTGEEAIRFAKHNLPDLILLDIMMPGTDGFEVCRVLKADPKTKDIPIIFLTAKDDRESLVEGFKLGAVDYILKPFFEAELIARVKTHLMIQNQKKEILINQRKYKGLFHNTPIGLYQTDPEGNILMANQYLIEMLEFDSFEDLTKRNLEKETIEEREDFKIKIEEKGFIQNYEYSVYTKTGKELIILENF